MEYNATNAEQATDLACLRTVQNVNWNIVTHASGDTLVNEGIGSRRKSNI